MALTKDTQLTFEIGDVNAFLVAAATKIFKGSAVGMPTGTGSVTPLIAGDVFVGFAEDSADNSAGQEGDVSVRVRRKGNIKATIAGLTIDTDAGTDVYMSDENTFTLTSTSNTFIGRLIRVEAGGTQGIVAFDAPVLKA